MATPGELTNGSPDPAVWADRFLTYFADGPPSHEELTQWFTAAVALGDERRARSIRSTDDEWRKVADRLAGAIEAIKTHIDGVVALSDAEPSDPPVPVLPMEHNEWGDALLDYNLHAGNLDPDA